MPVAKKTQAWCSGLGPRYLEIIQSLSTNCRWFWGQTTVDSKSWNMDVGWDIFAGVPSLICFGIRGRSYSTFEASTVGNWMGHAFQLAPNKLQVIKKGFVPCMREPKAPNSSKKVESTYWRGKVWAVSTYLEPLGNGTAKVHPDLPRTPSIWTIPTLGPELYKQDLLWAIWSI